MLTLVLHAPTEDALRNVLSDSPSLQVTAQRTGCDLSLTDDDEPRDLAEFLGIDTTGRG